MLWISVWDGELGARTKSPVHSTLKGLRDLHIPHWEDMVKISIMDTSTVFDFQVRNQP